MEISNIVFPLSSTQLLTENGYNVEKNYSIAVGIYYNNSLLGFIAQLAIHSTDIFIKHEDVETVLAFLDTAQLTSVLTGLGYLDEEGYKHGT